MSDCCSKTYWLEIALGICLIISIYSKFFRQRVWVYLLNDFAKSFQNFLEPGKKKLFSEAFDKIKNKTEEESIKIVEIGVGTGTNFQYYPKNSDIIISDKTDQFLPFIKESLKSIKREDLKIHDFQVFCGENMSKIESNSVDAVVATFTLCSVENLTKVFDEINRVLKPGGVFIFMDHSKNNDNLFMFIIQTIIEPLWGFIFDDCRFRDIKNDFQKYSKFEKLEIKEYTKCYGIRNSLLNPIFYGYAQKTQEK